MFSVLCCMTFLSKTYNFCSKYNRANEIHASRVWILYINVNFIYIYIFIYIHINVKDIYWYQCWLIYKTLFSINFYNQMSYSSYKILSHKDICYASQIVYWHHIQWFCFDFLEWKALDQKMLFSLYFSYKTKKRIKLFLNIVGTNSICLLYMCKL